MIARPDPANAANADPILIIIFIAGVWKDYAMPTFSGNVLALMGLSGGTYVGFKFKEKP